MKKHYHGWLCDCDNCEGFRKRLLYDGFSLELSEDWFHSCRREWLKTLVRRQRGIWDEVFRERKLERLKHYFRRNRKK